ncbi:hypothetical protein [uncultured Herbaspirillum sp.]|uniref:hypothetical protein n=1 Tax=uncultured Herbaspirillum sp. TaxID=160236 RepID=UPI00258923D9|nr:hypothetical protein [uncultured Herbaspirillum sp.]
MAKLPNRFSAEQAVQVLEFVEALPDNIRSIVVHCEGGFSRSCALVKALNALYGYSVDFEQLKEANPSVERALLAVAKQRAVKGGKGAGGAGKRGKNAEKR